MALGEIRDLTGIACHSCGAASLEMILSLGDVPLANALVEEHRLDETDERYPLELAICTACSMVQITEVTPPEKLFDTYVYFSSHADTFVEHARVLVERLVDQLALGPDDLVAEIASNDGYLLQHYVASGVPVLGIDPARNVVQEAERKGVRSLCEYFSAELAERLVSGGTRAKVIHANNVIAHVPALDSVMTGIATLLTDDGVAVIETPHVKEMVERREFDTIYHEHLFYYSLLSLQRVLRRNGLDVSDVERIPVHGGSLRVFARRPGEWEPSAAVTSLLDEERALGLDDPAHYRGFAAEVAALRDELASLLADLKARGHRIAGYGAAAKATVLLNAFDIGPDILDYVADRSPHKQGRYLPGVRIPIVAPDRLAADQPDDVVLLAWNFADEIVAQQSDYVAAGGRFIVPVPSPRVIEG